MFNFHHFFSRIKLQTVIYLNYFNSFLGKYKFSLVDVRLHLYERFWIMPKIKVVESEQESDIQEIDIYLAKSY